MSNNPEQRFVYDTENKCFVDWIDYLIPAHLMIFEGFSSKEEVLSVFVEIDGDCVPFSWEYFIYIPGFSRIRAFGDPFLFKAIRRRNERIEGDKFAVFDFGGGRRGLVPVHFSWGFRVRRATIAEKIHYYRVMRSRNN